MLFPLLGIDLGVQDFSFNIKTIASWELSESALLEEIYISIKGEIIQKLLKWSAVMTALLTLPLAVAHYAINKNPISLVIGISLFSSGVIDAIHVLFTSHLISSSISTSIYELTSITWMLSRTFHAGSLVIGAIICLRINQLQQSIQLPRILSLSIVYVIFIWVLMRLITGYPDFFMAFKPIYKVSFISNLFPVCLLMLSLPLLILLYKQQPCLPTASLLIALVPATSMQLYLAYGSFLPNDHYFNAANSLGLLSYLIPFIGIISEYIRIQKNYICAEAELKSYNAKLEYSNQQLDEFAYVASHDLKAPLRVIDNASKWLEEDLAEVLDKESKDNIDLLRNRVKRMEKLLDDLLEYSRIGRKKDSRFNEFVRGDVLVKDIIQILSPPEEFTIRTSPHLEKIKVNRMPLQHILMNLASNAIKHHDKPKGNIELSFRDEDDHFVFTVRDDGPGIPQEYQNQVFNMFQTLKPRDKVEGSGMGLAIVKKNIETYEQKLTLKSKVGEGCEFEFTWPKHQKDI